MAEQEIIKHTKKSFKIWNDSEFGFWHKLKEFLIEIFIIVFAVTLSIWLHSWSEHSHQQEEVKVFLLGLRSDLNNDIKEMSGDMESYRRQGRAFNYITSIKMNEHLVRDSMMAYQNEFFSTTWLVPNTGRFEGFKSSGKIGNIEDYTLQNDIMDLYQEDIPSLLNSTNTYVESKKQFFNYISQNLKRVTDSTSNLPVVLARDEARNICSQLAGVGQILERYKGCIDKMQQIVAQIEVNYDLETK